MLFSSAIKFLFSKNISYVHLSYHFGEQPPLLKTTIMVTSRAYTFSWLVFNAFSKETCFYLWLLFKIYHRVTLIWFGCNFRRLAPFTWHNFFLQTNTLVADEVFALLPRDAVNYKSTLHLWRTTRLHLSFEYLWNPLLKVIMQ